MNDRDYERARSALAFIPSDDRDVWVSMGMALKDGFGDEGFDLWDAWSRQSDRYDERDARDVWRSIKAGGGITLGTLFHEAKARSWRDDGTYQKPTLEEIEARRREAAERTAKEEAKKVREHTEAARKALAVRKAATGARGDHPYLVRKQVAPVAWLGEIDAAAVAEILGYAPKERDVPLVGRLLVVPVENAGELRTLEFIDESGCKAFLSGGAVVGGYWKAQKLPDGDGAGLTLLIGEGVATVLSAREATGHLVIAALYSSNLLAVARAMRKCFPAAVLGVLADLIKATGKPDPHAIEAALAVAGLVAVPDFGENRPEGLKDFNDMAALRGLEAVQRAIADAKAPAAKPGNGAAPAGACGGAEWPEPQPLTVKVAPEPYPIDALPDAMRAAVMEVQAFTKAPMVLAGASAMGALSMACQAHVDIERAKKLRGPTGLFLLTIADSGERKTTCDAFFGASIREYDADQADRLASELKDNRAAIAGWKAEHEGVLLAIREKSKKGKVPPALMESLKELEHYKPEPLRVPKISRLDDTPENLAWVLSKEWPSAGVASSDAGIVFGGHAMGKDSIMRNLSQLNRTSDLNHG
jgi:putative DNA primase/helicase